MFWCGFYLGFLFWFVFFVVCFLFFCFFSFALAKVLLTDVAFVLKGKSELKNIRKLADCLFLQAVVTAKLDNLTWSQ